MRDHALQTLATPSGALAALLLAALVLCAPAASCGRPDPPAGGSSGRRAPGRVPRAPRGEPGSAPGARPVDPDSTGTLAGRVLLSGTPPPRQPLVIGSASGCDHGGETPLSEDVVARDGALANVFVTIRSGLEGWIPPPPPEEPVHLEQRGCVYRPHVLGLRVEQSLSVSNADPATHNVRAKPRRSRGFNLTQPAGAAPISRSFAAREVPIPVVCDLHPWMGAWLCVEDHPWFAVSRPDGTFRIPGVPPGDYVLEAWHEVYGTATAEVSLEPRGSATATFTFEVP